ncbi:hypothetical protein [Luteipulveratus mongoliensis]|uniref:DALR anticodon binding domain-containing protein n=1 Tax=Luteipulveratus mongoliensis TaxID=571913 RepID=A0A0K1JLT1_9MICO|nr:hypothetical protein [Luteipulveratus mongoliensis]AKU17538.1 hypothetical protein VV02_19645 [Luteipulveratus mongoliensis]
MTPEQLGAVLAADLGAPVRLRPDVARAPYVWTTTALRDHAGRDAAAVARAMGSARHTPGVTLAGDELTLTLGPDDLDAVLDQQLDRTLVASVGEELVARQAPDRSWRLTRDATTTSYADLARLAGDASARWVTARSADGQQIDVARAGLGSRTPADPLFAVLLAHARLGRPPADGGERLLATVAETPMVLAEAARAGRTRPWILHLESVAEAALAWRASGQPPVCWTSARLAEAARIVLATGLGQAGIPAPTQI